MTEPCCTCMAHIGIGDACGLYCRLFNCGTQEATEKACHHHKYHLSEIEYKELVFMRRDNASE